MTYAKEEDAERKQKDKKEELIGREVIENTTQTKFKIVSVPIGKESPGPRGRDMGYTIYVSLSNEYEKKDVRLDRFEKEYTLSN